MVNLNADKILAASVLMVSIIGCITLITVLSAKLIDIEDNGRAALSSKMNKVATLSLNQKHSREILKVRMENRRLKNIEYKYNVMASNIKQISDRYIAIHCGPI